MRLPSSCDFNSDSTAFQFFQRWTGCESAFSGRARPVFTEGEGPPVVILHEVDGASPALFAFAHRVALRGFSTFVPILFGKPNQQTSQLYDAVQLVRACFGREFSCLNAHRSSPIINWVRTLGRCILEEARAKEPRTRGIGVVGLCLTGNFALAMAADDHLLAPVVSEPALPFPLPWAPKNQASLGLNDDELKALKERLRGGMEIAAFRFADDPIVPLERMEALENVAASCGSRLTGNFNVPPTCPNAHAVFTSHFNPKDRDSVEAFEMLIGFLQSKLA